MLINKNIFKMHLMLALISVSSLFIAMLAVAQTIDGVKMPDTPAGKTFAAFLAAFNTGDIEKLHSFYTGRGDNPSKANQDMNAYNKRGGLKPYSVIKSSDYEIEVLVQTMKTGEWFGFIMSVSTMIPYPIELRGMRAASAPEKASDKIVSESSSITGKLTDREIASLLGAYIDGLAREDKFSGVVLIAKEGKPIFQEAYGYASKGFKVPNKLDTKFNLGSLNKIFTEVAIAQLMEKGKLAIDDPIGKYLDMFPPEIANKVTIRHLLNMRSGWGDYWTNEYYLSHANRLRTVSDYMEFIKNIPLDFEPGSKFQHSNIGYEVAGAIIEKVSGMDYFDYIKKNIYESAGMANTDSYHRDGPAENLAMGYTNMTGNKQDGKGYEWNNIYLLSPRGTPSGGGYSTVEDLLKFDQALRNHRLLNSDYTQYLIGRFEGSPGDPFSPPDKTYPIRGAFPGVNTFLGMEFKSSHSIIVLSNYDPPAGMEVAEEIIRMLGIE